MTQEDKELLLTDLSARLPYGVICYGVTKDTDEDGNYIDEEVTDTLCELHKYKSCYGLVGLMNKCNIESIKPYLRPMSSMTEEEAMEIAILHDIKDILSVKVTSDYIDVIVDDGVCSTERRTIWYDEIVSSIKCFDWLNKKMFAYRTIDGKDMFELGLALEALSEMYK